MSAALIAARTAASPIHVNTDLIADRVGALPSNRKGTGDRGLRLSFNTSLSADCVDEPELTASGVMAVASSAGVFGWRVEPGSAASLNTNGSVG